jgi:hypothetical protein
MGIFSLIGEDPHGDHGLGSQYNLGLRPPIRPVTRYRRSPRWRELITFGSLKVRLCQHISYGIADLIKKKKNLKVRIVIVYLLLYFLKRRARERQTHG